VSQALDELKKRPDFNTMGMPELCNYLVEQGKPIKVLYIHGHWLNVNSIDDIDRAGNFTNAANQAIDRET